MEVSKRQSKKYGASMDDSSSEEEEDDDCKEEKECEVMKDFCNKEEGGFAGDFEQMNTLRKE